MFGAISFTSPIITPIRVVHSAFVEYGPHESSAIIHELGMYTLHIRSIAVNIGLSFG